MLPAKASLFMNNKDLISYLHPDLYIPELKARGKNDAIKKMVTHLAKSDRVRNERIVIETLKSREQLGSTGIGKGIAIPHGRTTVTRELIVLFARSTKGIAFDASDGEPVHLFFMVLAPHVDKENQYLPLLGRIVEVTRSATVRKQLLQAPDFEAMTAVLAKAEK